MENRKKAFTLVEMMAVVVIIAILAAVVAPKFFGQVNRAQQVRAKQDIEKLKNQVTLYRFDTNKWPEDLRDLTHDPGEVKGWNGPYLEKGKTKDPWDQEYQYRQPGLDGREFDIWSYGADEKEGGEGNDADVVSWVEED